MIRRSRYYFLILYMAGFFIGILYANFLGITYLYDTGIFHEYFLNQYVNREIWMEQYLVYLVKQRVVPLALLAVSASTRFRKIAAIICLLWTGFAGGTLAVTAIVRMGIAGMFYYAAAMVPQGFFYVFAYIIILCYLFDIPIARWNVWKTIFVVLSFSAGILTEVYVNPHVIKWFIRILG